MALPTPRWWASGLQVRENAFLLFKATKMCGALLQQSRRMNTNRAGGSGNSARTSLSIGLHFPQGAGHGHDAVGAGGGWLQGTLPTSHTMGSSPGTPIRDSNKTRAPGGWAGSRDVVLGVTHIHGRHWSLGARMPTIKASAPGRPPTQQTLPQA